MSGLVERADDYQRRRPAVGLPLAVVYKFFDDQGNYLAAVVTYYGFFAIFPMMLIASSVLGFVLQDNRQLEQQLLDSALAQFPIVGSQLGRTQGLQGSASAVGVGALVALYGITNLGQAAVNSLNVVWGVPRNTRMNPVHGRLRSLVLFVIAGLSLLTVAVLPGAAGKLGADVLGSGAVVRTLASAASVVLTAVALAVMMLIASSTRQRLRTVLPGAVFVAVLWQGLQQVGGVYVDQVVTRVNDVNAVFALVLGLLGLIYVGSVIGVLGVEVNVVLADRLYPRALLTPFTDDVELTEADRQVYARYAQAQRHKGFERITVTFDHGPRDDRDERGTAEDD